MANFFEGLWNAAKHPLDEGQFLFDVGRGKIKLEDAPGEHQRMMNKTTVPILGDNKIAKNSDAVAGAIVGGFLAAPAIGGAMGGAAGGSGGGSFGFGGFGTEGAFGKYFQPISESVGNFFSGTPSDELLGQLADAEGAGDVAGAEEIMKKIQGSGFSMDKLEGIGRALSNIQGAPKQSLSHSSRGGGGFRGSSSKNLAQSLLDREYESLYSQPLYNPLTKNYY